MLSVEFPSPRYKTVLTSLPVPDYALVDITSLSDYNKL